MLDIDSGVAVYIRPSGRILELTEYVPSLESQSFSGQPNERYIEAAHKQRFEIVIRIYPTFDFEGSKGVKICCDVDQGRQQVTGVVSEVYPVTAREQTLVCVLPESASDISGHWSVSELTFELPQEGYGEKTPALGKIAISIERGDSTPEEMTSAETMDRATSSTAATPTRFKFSPGQGKPVEFTFWYTSQRFIARNSLINPQSRGPSDIKVVLAPICAGESSTVPKTNASSTEAPLQYTHRQEHGDETLHKCKYEHSEDDKDSDPIQPKIKTEESSVPKNILNYPPRMNGSAPLSSRNKVPTGQSPRTPIEISDDDEEPARKKRKVLPQGQTLFRTETSAPKRRKISEAKDDPDTDIKQEDERMITDRIVTEPADFEPRCKGELRGGVKQEIKEEFDDQI